MTNPAFWRDLTRLVAESEIVIDRPKGSRHPVMTHIIYPVDYGYLKNTRSMDKEGIDIWVGAGNPMDIQGIICTVDLFKRDSEIKILYRCTPEETGQIIQFTNAREGMKGIFIPFPGQP